MSLLVARFAGGGHGGALGVWVLGGLGQDGVGSVSGGNHSRGV